MHRYMQRLQACEASGWAPFRQGLVKDTQIHHAKGCGLLRGGLCNCEGPIRVKLRDGRVFALDADGVPKQSANH